jgi:uncharacterized UBP type Zn finger protein
MTPNRSGMVRAHGVSLNGSGPRCQHVDRLASVPVHASSCRECRVAGVSWIGLMACLTCGWVACSDDSPGRHALAHYEETDHPVARALRSGPAWRWCYVHRRTV